MDAPNASPKGVKGELNIDKVPRAVTFDMEAQSDQGGYATPLPSSEDGAGTKERPPAEAVAIPESEAVKRHVHTAQELRDGNLLLTEVMWGTVRTVRSLKLNEATSVLSWTYGLSFIRITEKVPLRKAWVMCKDKLIKIAVEGKDDLYEFETCDENETKAVRHILSDHAARCTWT